MLNSFPICILVGTVLGFLSGLGIGGGSLLILWLTAVLETALPTARAMNLLFFLPAALSASIFRIRQGVIQWKTAIPAAIAGCIAAGIVSVLGNGMDMSLLRRLFGGLLVLTGLRELFYRPRKAR